MYLTEQKALKFITANRKKKKKGRWKVQNRGVVTLYRKK